ncbi:MAG: transposase [Planctomycetes bacterium]|jgi:transposase|nr:transposase [Planctomycetota bacterium]
MWLRENGNATVIPKRDDQIERYRGRPIEFDKKTYRRRNLIACFVGWLKEFCAISIRIEKLAMNFLAMFKRALIQRYLRFLDSSDRT